MSTTKISNFSIDHILGNEMGPSYTTEDLSSPNVGCFSRSGIFFQGPPNELNENWNFHTPRPLFTDNVPQVPTLHSLGYSGSDLGYGSFHHHHPDFNLYPGAQYRGFNDERGTQPQCSYLGQVSNQRQRGRIRTVFTDSQTRQLEHLFQITDYPAVDARAELARNSGLMEETIRVWFKNRRARRKRQRTKAKCPEWSRREVRDGPTAYNSTVHQENAFSGFC